MAKHRDLEVGDVLPESMVDALQEYISTLASNVSLGKASNTSIEQVAGPGSALVALGIGGLWRFNTANVGASMPVGAAAGSFDVYAVASANSFSDTPAPDTDNTDYSFGLRILAAGGTPTGLHGGAAIVAYRKIATLDYDGTQIVRIIPLTGGVGASGTAAVYNQTIGDGIAIAFNIDHNMNTRDVIVRVREANTPWAEVTTEVEYFSTTRVIVRTEVPPTSNSLVVTVMGIKS